jgi:hypothetical protein
MFNISIQIAFERIFNKLRAPNYCPKGYMLILTEFELLLKTIRGVFKNRSLIHVVIKLKLRQLFRAENEIQQIDILNHSSQTKSIMRVTNIIFRKKARQT